MEAPKPPSDIRLDEPLLEVARRLVKNCLFDPAADALEDDDTTGDAADMMRRSAALLDRLGWPGSVRRQAAVMSERDAELVRLAALATLGAAGEALDEAASSAGRHHVEWDADAVVHDLEDCIALLDVVGWPRGSERTRAVSASEPHDPGDDRAVLELLHSIPLPAWLIDDALRILAANPAAEALIVVLQPGAELVGMVDAADRDRVRRTMTAAHAEERPLQVRAQLVTAAGTHPYMICCNPRFDADGSLRGYLAMAVHERP